jgi:hypothetical protein
LLSAAVACWWWWLASCLPSPPSSAPGLVLLLLDLLLITCPSPPGLGLELQSIIMVLLEVFVWCCARTCDVLGVVCKNSGVLVMVQCWTCECCFPWWCSSGRLLVLLAAVVLPAPASSSVTKLLVSCVPVSSLSLISSTPGRVVQLLCTLVLCTPVI